MIDRNGQQPDPGLLIEEEDDYPERNWRPVETVKTVLDEPATAHEHEPSKDPDGTIRCASCTLAVPRPARMPDYGRAGMGRWT